MTMMDDKTRLESYSVGRTGHARAEPFYPGKTRSPPTYSHSLRVGIIGQQRSLPKPEDKTCYN